MSVPRVIVRNLDRDEVREGDKDEIRSRFREFGAVTNVWMADDPPGFAYVFFEVFKDAIKAVEELHQTRMCGRRVEVELSPSEDKRKNRGGWAARGSGEGGGGYRSGDRGGWDRGGGGGGSGGGGGGSGYRDNSRPRGRGGGFRSYDRDYRDDHGGRDYDNRGQRYENRDSYRGGGGWKGGRGGGGGGYNNYRGGRGRGGGGYQQRWGGRGSYGRDNGGYRGRGGFNRDRNHGDSYSDRGGRSHGGRGGRGGGGSYYDRDSYDKRNRRDDYSDEEGASRAKDYEYRESRSSGGGGYSGGDHKSEPSRSKRYSSSPEYVKEEVRPPAKYRKRSDGDDYHHHSSSAYHHSHPPPESSSKWDSSPYHQGGGGGGGSPAAHSYTRSSRSRSRSPYTAPEYYSPPRDNYHRSSKKTLEKRSGSYEHLDQYPAVEEAPYSSSNRSFERRADYSPEPAEPAYGDYRDKERDRTVKYGEPAEGSRSGSRHYKSSKRAGSEEPMEQHKVRDVDGGGSGGGGGGRYMALDEEGGSRRSRNRGHERGNHPRAYPAASREPGERERRRGTPPPRHPSSPPSHKRSRSESLSPSPPPAMIRSPIRK